MKAENTTQSEERQIESGEQAELEREEINKIKEQSLKEYNEIQKDSNNKTKTIQLVLLAGILILIVLTINTVLKTKDVTIERVDNNSATINTQIDEDGRIISTQELK